MHILFDIGGTKMRVSCTEDCETFHEPIIADTPSDPREGIELLFNRAAVFTKKKPIESVCGGIAGTFSHDTATLLRSPNLPDWENFPIRKEITRFFKAPVTIVNDAALVGVGEATFGAGKGHSIVAYITVSTGVGGARIVDGAIDKYTLGFEPGHQIIDPDNTLCPECEGNDLESYISGTAVTKRFGKKPYEITDPIVWDELAKFLAYGLNNTIVHWSPDIIVIGGAIMKKVGIPF